MTCLEKEELASADIRFGGGGEAGSTGRTDGKGRVVSGLGGLCLRMRSDSKGVVLTHPQWENRAWACCSAGNGGTHRCSSGTAVRAWLRAWV